MRASPFRVMSIASFVAAVLLFNAGSGAAHHSGEMFEREKTITVEGVVKEFQYVNPHSWLIVDITSEDGSTETWGFEAEGPTILVRGGVFKNDLQAGDRITITARPMRDGRPAGAWSEVIKEDGMVLNWGTPGRD